MIPRKLLAVTRKNNGSWVNNNWVVGTTATLTISASVHPVDGENLLLIPENRRDEENYMLITNTALLVANAGGAQNSDIVSLYGDSYEVVNVKKYLNLLNYYAVLVVKNA